MTLPNYQKIDLIYTSDHTLVYRGIDKHTEKKVIIKMLRNEYPTFAELVQFRNQYTIAKNLDFPNIIKPLALEVHGNGYVLIMEDVGGISLSNYLQNTTEKKKNPQSKYLPIAEFIDISIKLTESLHYLYQNRVIHKDIKPANILINPESKQVKLIDFSIASLLPRETQEIQNANSLEGTLAYLSPEQTGRMNRGIDYRSDFYSLGVTLYELLTGQLPFVSEDPMELVHCHLAKQPIEIHKINPDIPLAISKIVGKLMAKNAEERYQTALGIKYDLEQCLTQLEEQGKIDDFELGRLDNSDRFTIPEKLYGRQNEVEELLKAFERVSTGSSEMMLVAGYSGIGKTAVVNEVHKPIVRQRGYFIEGKYDQFNRNIPFSAFVQAFRNLMGQLLSEPDAKIESWKKKIIEALGENGQVLIDVIPELENIIGEQPPVLQLSGMAAQNRFNLLLQKFVQVFTNKEHPLVMFLDDLQWADSASLKLLKLLMEDTEYLLILGAYRDNEVSPVHPFILTAEEMLKTGATINTITLAPLQESDINQLIADTLNCELSLALPLTKNVYQKTKGNPFFATQFLKALHEDGLINFDWEIQHWQCDLAKVNALALTDDVVEFMALQLQKLPAETQELLRLAACIGAGFDLNTLAIVSEKAPATTATVLWKALQEGLVIPTTKIYKFFTQSDTEETFKAAVNSTYRFLHDRVQQAAYFLIPDEQKQATHLKIGKLLQQNLSEIEKEEKLFDILGHFNLAIELITQPEEREALAKLNLAGGQKARNSTAYSAAKNFLQTGIKLLPGDCWESQYELTLNLYVACTEAAYLNGEFEEMETMAALVLQSAKTILDKVKIYEIQINARTTQSQMLEAIALGQKALEQFGILLPLEPDEALSEKTRQSLNLQLQGQEISELINLPMMSDPQSIAAMQLLAMLFLPIFIGNTSLLPVYCSQMVSLSLEFGNTAASTIGYVAYGMVEASFFGEAEKGYYFGRLGLNLLNKLNVREFKCQLMILFCAFLQHRKEPLREGATIVKEGYFAGMETGDFLNAGYCMVNYFYDKFFAGIDLEDLESEIDNYCVVFNQLKQNSPLVYLKLKQQTVRNFREIVQQQDVLSGTAYNETEMIPLHFQNQELTAIAYLNVYKLMLAYIFGNYTNALDCIDVAKEYIVAMTGVPHIPAFHFYAALTYLRLINQGFSDSEKPGLCCEIEQANTLPLVETHLKTVAQWAKDASMNHQHKVDLIEAEKCRVFGKNYEAGDWYDRAIAGAKKNKYLHEEGVANELAATFYLAWGKEKIAAGYMQEAYYCYGKWGSIAKVADLEKRYPQLLKPILQSSYPTDLFKETITRGKINTSTKSSSTISEVLDLGTLLKASQAISGEIELEKLLKTLLEIAIANAGASKCVLLLKQQMELKIVGLLEQGNSAERLPSIPLELSHDVPMTIVNKVKRTLKPLVFADARLHPQFSADSYLQRQQPKSVLCSPILNQGELIGILYLENNLTVDAFTSDRVAILHLICSQAAISLENARLYQESQQAFTDLKQAQLKIVQSEKMSALGNLVAGVAHEINNPIGFLAGNIPLALDYIQDLFDLLELIREKYPELHPEIEEKIKDMELDYIQEDLPNIVDSMQEGVKRIQDISTSLRTFSRADKDYPVACNIHDGIDSTIMILKHRLKANQNHPNIEIIKEYGDLPPIKCYAGQLNQVFMNILSNAIDALEESNQGHIYKEIHNEITVKTELSPDQKQVIVRIKDNGIGMVEAVRQKIFEDLFTTKGVGKGTGLGLAIARQIVVEKHGGTLDVLSELGKGSQFIIGLPMSVG